MTTLICIDSREIGAPYVQYLKASAEVEVVFKPLAAGDIVVNDLGIERKTVRDFFLTLREGRLFAQLHKLKQQYRRQLLLIEGAGLRYHLDQEPLFGLYIRLAAGWQLPVLHTQNGEQTAGCLVRMCHQDIVAPAGPIRPRPRNPAYRTHSVAVKMLVQIHGIGPSRANRLIGRFGSLDRIFAAGQNELRKVPGIGKKRAQAIQDANHPEPAIKPNGRKG